MPSSNGEDGENQPPEIVGIAPIVLVVFPPIVALRVRPRSAFRAARTRRPGGGGLEVSLVSIFNTKDSLCTAVYGPKRARKNRHLVRAPKKA